MTAPLMDTIAVIELMLKDLQQEHAQALSEEPELGTAMQMAYRQIYNARLAHGARMAKAQEPEAVLPQIRLTQLEKWVLRNLGSKPEGISTQLLRAEHDRLIANKLIEQVEDRFYITAEGRAHLETLLRLPGYSGKELSRQA